MRTPTVAAGISLETVSTPVHVDLVDPVPTTRVLIQVAGNLGAYGPGRHGHLFGVVLPPIRGNGDISSRWTYYLGLVKSIQFITASSTIEIHNAGGSVVQVRVIEAGSEPVGHSCRDCHTLRGLVYGGVA